MKLIKVSAVLLGCLVFDVHAGDDTWLFGLKAGFMSEKPFAVTSNDPINVGFAAQYNLSRPNNLYIEAEYSLSVSDGSEFDTNEDWKIRAASLSGVYKSAGKTYFKGKLGYVYNDILLENIETGEQSHRYKNSAIIGAGVGWRNLIMGNALELEVSHMEDDINFISVNLYF